MARFILGHRFRALGDRNGRIARLLYRLDHAFFSLLLWLIRLLPPTPASRFGATVGAALGPRFKKSRALDENLRIAFPDLDDAARKAVAREAWANAGAVFAEYAHLEAIGDLRNGRLEIRRLADIPALQPGGRPAIFLAAHQANWEIAGAAIASHGTPLSTVYSPPTNPLLAAVLTQWRGRMGCEQLPRDESMRPMIKALTAGRSLGLVVDRRVDSGKPVPLFGEPKPTTLVPARLALRYGHDLVPLRIERLGPARFRATFYPPVTPPEGDDEIDRAIAMMREVHGCFEAWFRERPGEWFPSKRLWPKETYAHGATPQAALPTHDELPQEAPR